jgi:hypothetical protein
MHIIPEIISTVQRYLSAALVTCFFLATSSYHLISFLRNRITTIYRDENHPRYRSPAKPSSLQAKLQIQSGVLPIQARQLDTVSTAAEQDKTRAYSCAPLTKPKCIRG